MASGKESNVQECEDYVEKHGIQGILKDCIAKLCQERPANPYKYLREYFEKLEKVCQCRLSASPLVSMLSSRYNHLAYCYTRTIDV